MKKLSEQSLTIRHLLKEKLREQYLTYKDLARLIEVSEPTIKRWMTKDDWPVNSLLSAFEILGISWSDLDRNLQNTKSAYASEKQELFVSQNPKEAYIYLLIATGFQFERIKKKLNLSFESLEKICLKLDKHNFVSYVNPKKMRPLVKLPLRWTSSGKFSKKYFKICADYLYHQLLIPNSGYKDKFDPTGPLIYASELMLTETKLIRFKTELYELIEKYKDENKHLKNSSERKPVGILLALDSFSLWEKAMWQTEI